MEADHPFLYHSFLRSFRLSDHSDGIPNTLFFDVFKQEWAAVLGRFNVLVAHPDGDPDEIAGYLVYRAHVAAWLYVKKTPWRQMGVAKLLLGAAGFAPGRPMSALFGSSRALWLARSKGYVVRMVPHVEAVRMLVGVA